MTDRLEQLAYARKTVKRHLDTVLSTAETERYDDLDDQSAAGEVLDSVDDRSLDPDVDLAPGFAAGVRVARGPDLRGPIRDIALALDLAIAHVVGQVGHVAGRARSTLLQLALAAVAGAVGGLVVAALR